MRSGSRFWVGVKQRSPPKERGPQGRHPQYPGTGCPMVPPRQALPPERIPLSQTGSSAWCDLSIITSGGAGAAAPRTIASNLDQGLIAQRPRLLKSQTILAAGGRFGHEGC
jgi:hypothetical protein